MILITCTTPSQLPTLSISHFALAMNGMQVFLLSMAYGQLLAGGEGCAGDDPSRRPWDPKAVHDANNDGPVLHMINDPIRDRPYRCPVCHRHFPTLKAVHGHYRIHN